MIPKAVKVLTGLFVVAYVNLVDQNILAAASTFGLLVCFAYEIVPADETWRSVSANVRITATLEDGIFVLLGELVKARKSGNVQIGWYYRGEAAKMVVFILRPFFANAKPGTAHLDDILAGAAVRWAVG